MPSADNSEWMRNGDYVPNRLEAEKDAIRMLGNAKVDQNVENTVGLVTMAGRAYVLYDSLNSHMCAWGERERGRESVCVCDLSAAITVIDPCSLIAALQLYFLESLSDLRFL
jgi:hypothetical protein